MCPSKANPLHPISTPQPSPWLTEKAEDALWLVFSLALSIALAVVSLAFPHPLVVQALGCFAAAALLAAVLLWLQPPPRAYTALMSLFMAALAAGLWSLSGLALNPHGAVPGLLALAVGWGLWLVALGCGGLALWAAVLTARPPVVPAPLGNGLQ